jgi:hypothetical protein
MKLYVSKEVVCPFYKEEETVRIRCEGFSSKCSLQTTFADHVCLQAHKKRFCNSMERYPECPLYPPIYGQYGDDG